MSGSGRFCPRCGEPLAEEGGYAAPDRRGNTEAELCLDCYLEGLDLVAVPEQMSVHVCTQCGSIREGGTWRTPETEDLTDIAIEAVWEQLQVHRDARAVEWTVEPIQRGPNELDLDITVVATVAERRVEETHVVSVTIARETCQTCGRKAGDYYAGTVQVRAAERTPTDAETDRAIEIAHEVIEATDDRDVFVSEIRERPEGVDVRVSTNRIASRIADRVTDELGGTVESSETLVTEDGDGRGVYRVAFAVRLPRFRPGDVVVSSGGDPVLVEGDVRGRTLTTGEPVTIEDDGAEVRRVARIEDAMETTLVTVEDTNAIQVLDPDTAAAVTIPRPADLDVEGDTVHVVKTEAGLHAVPTPAVEEAST